MIHKFALQFFYSNVLHDYICLLTKFSLNYFRSERFWHLCWPKILKRVVIWLSSSWKFSARLVFRPSLWNLLLGVLGEALHIPKREFKKIIGSRFEESAYIATVVPHTYMPQNLTTVFHCNLITASNFYYNVCSKKMSIPFVCHDLKIWWPPNVWY